MNQLGARTLLIGTPTMRRSGLKLLTRIARANLWPGPSLETPQHLGIYFIVTLG